MDHTSGERWVEVDEMCVKFSKNNTRDLEERYQLPVTRKGHRDSSTLTTEGLRSNEKEGRVLTNLLCEGYSQ